MSNFIYHIDFHIKSEKTTNFEKYFSKIIHAYKKHPTGAKHPIKLERTVIGGNDVITLTIGMNSLEEIGTWGHTPAIVLEYYGQEVGMEILDQYCQSMERWQSKVTKPYEITMIE